MNIEVITTDNSHLKETGYGLLASCRSVAESVALGHSSRLSVCNSVRDLDAVVRRKPNIVMLAAKYIEVSGGQDIWLSEYFEDHKIAYTGSNRETLRYDSDKILAKARMRQIGVDTARYFSARPGEFTAEANLPLPFPLFLKPIGAANGNGIDEYSLVSTRVEFESKLHTLSLSYRGAVLAEEYLAGKEFTVSILEGDDGELVSSAIEVLPPQTESGLRILGSIVKSSDSEELNPVSPDMLAAVTKLAIDAYVGLGVVGFGRIDVKTDGDGKCYFLEANLVPGMTRGSSYFPRACEIASGFCYDEVVSLMLATASVSQTNCDTPSLLTGMTQHPLREGSGT